MFMLRHLAAAALAVAVASPAMALEAHKSVMVDATPAQAWAAVGDFCGISTWHPAVEKCELGKKDGKTIRTLSLKGGGTLVEEETAHGKTSYSYAILSGPLPVEKYRSTLKVEETGRPHGDRLERQVRRQGRAGREGQGGDRRHLPGRPRFAREQAEDVGQTSGGAPFASGGGLR